jgi:iron(III) transport system substrate-binding protein
LGATALIVISLLGAACSGGGARAVPSEAAGQPATGAPSVALGAVGASPEATAPEPTGTLVIYSTFTQATVDAVVAVYTAAHPGVQVDLFRAPTGEVAARIAAEKREGRVRADVLWLTDPLSMQAYDADGLLATYAPADAGALDASDQASTYWATRLLNMVIVAGTDVSPAPADWSDLTDTAYKDAVALPDPGFAGSAFAVLGHLALDPTYGFDYYRALRDNGAVQVRAPDEVTTGVAEGRFKVGITLDFSVRAAVAKGSPVKLVWPVSGSIAVYSPIAMVATSENLSAAASFIDVVLSPQGQSAVAGTGWQPARRDIAGGPPIEGIQVRPDWAAAYGRQTELLEQYRAIFDE